MAKSKALFIIIVIYVFLISISYSEKWIEGYYDDSGEYIYGHYENNQKGNIYDYWRKEMYLSVIFDYRNNKSGTPLEYFYNDWTYNQKYDLQLKLKELDYYYGDLDADVGPITINAVKKFQKDNKLKIDGKAGPNTSKAIDKIYSESISNSNSNKNSNVTRIVNYSNEILS